MVVCIYDDDTDDNDDYYAIVKWHYAQFIFQK